MLEITIYASNQVEFKRLTKKTYFSLLDSLQVGVLTGEVVDINKAINIALGEQTVSPLAKICFKTFISNGDGWLTACRKSSKRQIVGIVEELKRSFNLNRTVFNFDYDVNVRPNFI